jgi:hypothetical protein
LGGGTIALAKLMDLKAFSMYLVPDPGVLVLASLAGSLLFLQ